MTAADLARVKAAIDADERTLASNWPLARERERLYLATATAVNLYGLACVTGINENNARGDMFRALAALAPDADAGE